MNRAGQKTLFAVITVLATTVLCIGVLEIALRIIRDPIDLLKPDRIRHDVLGHAIAPETGGHDARGYRNPNVPDRADVVVLGDSITYGFVARMRESWPSQLGELTGDVVYNMGVGGYGPAEYAYLLETEVIALQPRRVLVGLYFGNDLHNAYISVLRRPHWRSLRATTPADWPAADDPNIETTHSVQFVDEMSPRRWLRGRSMLVRSFEASPLGQRLNAIGDARPKQADGAHCNVAIESPFATVLKLETRRIGIELESDGVTTGLALTLTLVEQMASTAEAAGIELVVVLIPGKEHVLADRAGPLAAECRTLLDQLVTGELEAVRQVTQRLDALGVEWIDAFPPLHAASMRERIYLRSADTHPTAAGYHAIAAEVALALGPANGPRAKPSGESS